VYDFLSLINTNLDPILHRYWDSNLLAEIANFSYPFLIPHPRSGWPALNLLNLNFMVSETRVFQAADGKDLVILACTVFNWTTCVLDRQTDRIVMSKMR